MLFILLFPFLSFSNEIPIKDESCELPVEEMMVLVDEISKLKEELNNKNELIAVLRKEKKYMVEEFEEINTKLKFLKKAYDFLKEDCIKNHI